MHVFILGMGHVGNQQVFDTTCKQADMPALVFLNQVTAPLKKISADKIYATGYRVQHPDPNAHLIEDDA